jgi:hypothetical protein
MCAKKDSGNFLVESEERRQYVDLKMKYMWTCLMYSRKTILTADPIPPTYLVAGQLYSCQLRIRDVVFSSLLEHRDMPLLPFGSLF